MASIPQVSPPTPYSHLSPPQYMPHAPPISFFSILPTAQYWARIIDHSSPHYVTFSIPVHNIACETPLYINTMKI
jgi:hypothetical protein